MPIDTKKPAAKKAPAKKAGAKVVKESYKAFDVGGRPQKFKKPEDLAKKITAYFNSITITTPRTHSEVDQKETIRKNERDEDGKLIVQFKTVPSLNNLGEQIHDTRWIEIPSILGLCRYLDIHRSTLIDYESKEGFSNTIKEAKSIIEQYNADELYRDKNVTGIIFNLKNNFGWVDKQELESTTVNVDFKRESYEEADLSKLMQEIKELTS